MFLGVCALSSHATAASKHESKKQKKKLIKRFTVNEHTLNAGILWCLKMVV